MPRFFVGSENIDMIAKTVIIDGDDAHHITRVLRMAAGDIVSVCDYRSNEYTCRLVRFGDTVTAEIINVKKNETEPPYRARLFQALPKGDKLDEIIQKAVECGVWDITPFESERCVAKSKAEQEQRRTERRNRIAYEAAKQCGRGIIPRVNSVVGFSEMLKLASAADLVLFCYEGDNTVPICRALWDYNEKNTLTKNEGGHPEEVSANTGAPEIAIIIGPEGGFSIREAEAARNLGFVMTGLGKRILRTETASVFALAAVSAVLEQSAME